MQRDFLEPGGFGATLGNDVSLLQRHRAGLPARCWRPGAQAGWPVVHTREAHRPDLSDCPPAKRDRGDPRLRIGDAGPMGRILVAGEPGNQIVAGAGAAARRDRDRQARQGRLLRHRAGRAAAAARASPTCCSCGVTTEVCVQTTMREANDRGYECLLVEDCTESYFPHSRPRRGDDARAGRHRRLDRDQRQLLTPWQPRMRCNADRVCCRAHHHPPTRRNRPRRPRTALAPTRSTSSSSATWPTSTWCRATASPRTN